MAFTYNPSSQFASQPWKRYAASTSTRPAPPSPSQVFGKPAAPPTSPTGVSGPDVSWQDSIYNLTGTTVNRDNANAAAGLLNQSNQLGSDYGIDPTTNQIAANVDVTNPFSKAALLKRAYQSNVGAINSSAASAGQFYSGATQGSQNTAAFNNLQGQDALLKGYGSDKGNLIAQYLATQRAGQDTTLNAGGDALLRHENDPAYARPKPAGPSPGAVFGRRKPGPRGQINPTFAPYVRGRR